MQRGRAPIRAAARRPPSNFGLISTGGSYDHKLIENVTNMHDALLERYAARRFGDLSAVPYASPREAAEALFADVDQSELARQATVELCQAGAPARAAKRITAVFRDEGCGIEPETWPAPSSRWAPRTSRMRAGSRERSVSAWSRSATRKLLSSLAAARRNCLRARSVVVSVALWVHSDKGKGLHYLVTSDWREGENIHAEPWSAPASAYPIRTWDAARLGQLWTSAHPHQ